MFNKYGHINEDFFGSYDEDEFKEELVNDIENELVGEKVPTNITELDSYKYKFEFYFTGMKYSKIPAVNVARFAKFKRWFMYAVEQCHIIQNCSEPVFCAYLDDFQKTDEIKRFGDALFNNTDYDINHKIFWDTKKKKYGPGYLKFTFGFNATVKTYYQVMLLLTTLCVVFQKASKKAFDGKKSDGSVISRCQPSHIFDIESHKTITLWDIRDIHRRTKKSYNTFAAWCQSLAGLKKSIQMLNYYNRSNDDEKTVALYRYIDAQFDEIVKNDENGVLCLELHTDYKPKKNPSKNYDKVVKSGYKGMIIVPKPTSELNKRYCNYCAVFTLDSVNDVKALEQMLDENRPIYTIYIKFKKCEKSNLKKTDVLDLSVIQSKCQLLEIDFVTDNNDSYYNNVLTGTYPKVIVYDKVTGRNRTLKVDCHQNIHWKSINLYKNGNVWKGWYGKVHKYDVYAD